MERGDKRKYTAKQKRMARHIEKGYESRGVSEDVAAARAWATVNRQTGGGRKAGSGRRKRAGSRTSTAGRSTRGAGARRSGRTAATRSRTTRSAAAKKVTRARRK